MSFTPSTSVSDVTECGQSYTSLTEDPRRFEPGSLPTWDVEMLRTLSLTITVMSGFINSTRRSRVRWRVML